MAKVNKPEKPLNYCYFCHSPFEYEWYEAEAGAEADGELPGFWMEIPCQTCAERQKELAAYLEELSNEGKLELDNRDRLLIEESKVELKEDK